MYITFIIALCHFCTRDATFYKNIFLCAALLRMTSHVFAAATSGDGHSKPALACSSMVRLSIMQASVYVHLLWRAYSSIARRIGRKTSGGVSWRSMLLCFGRKRHIYRQQQLFMWHGENNGIWFIRTAATIYHSSSTRYMPISTMKTHKRQQYEKLSIARQACLGDIAGRAA